MKSKKFNCPHCGMTIFKAYKHGKETIGEGFINVSGLYGTSSVYNGRLIEHSCTENGEKNNE